MDRHFAGPPVLARSWFALAFPTGTVAGVLVEGAAYTVVLAFAAVASLFLVLEGLLREAHEVAETAWTTSMMFGGLRAFLLLETLA